MLSYCIDAMLVTIATPIFPRLQSMLGVDNLQIGYLFAMKAVVQLLADPLLAPLANRGHNWLISLGLFIEVATSAGMAFATCFSSLLVLRGLQGIASAMIMTTGMSWVARVYAHNDQARGTALSVVMMGVAVGVAIGPTVGGLLFEVGGLRLTFLAMAILAFIVLGLDMFGTDALQIRDAGCQKQG
jgi:MFS family permease